MHGIESCGERNRRCETPRASVCQQSSRSIGMEKLGCSISLNKQFTRMSARQQTFPQRSAAIVVCMRAAVKFHWIFFCDRVPIGANRSLDEPLSRSLAAAVSAAE